MHYKWNDGEGADSVTVGQWVRVFKSRLGMEFLKSFQLKCHQCEFASETHCVMQP